MGEKSYCKLLIEASILKAKEVRLEVLRQPKTTKNKEIIPFTTAYIPNHLIVFSVIKQSFDNFQYSKTSSKIFQMKNLVNSISKAINLGSLICRSKFESKCKNDKV